MVMTAPFDVFHIERRSDRYEDLGPIMPDCNQELKRFGEVSANNKTNRPGNRDICPDFRDDFSGTIAP